MSGPPPFVRRLMARGRATREALANPEDFVEQTFRDPVTEIEETFKVLPRQGPGGSRASLLSDLEAYLRGEPITLPKGAASAADAARTDWQSAQGLDPEAGLDLFGPARPNPLANLMEGLYHGKGLHPKVARNLASKQILNWLRSQEPLRPLQSTPEDFLFGETPPKVKPK